jgi:alpha-beta hydrolase superfamily lysophospholipase
MGTPWATRPERRWPIVAKDEAVHSSTFTLASADGLALFIHRWLPEATPKAVVQIAHGLTEHALREIAKPARQARIPKQLPIYVIAGTRDPVRANSKGLKQLLSAYHVAGLQRVTYRFYPEGRHELLNETNRDQVTRELLAWLDEATGNRNYSGRGRPQPTGRRPWA